MALNPVIVMRRPTMTVSFTPLPPSSPREDSASSLMGKGATDLALIIDESYTKFTKLLLRNQIKDSCTKTFNKRQSQTTGKKEKKLCCKHIFKYKHIRHSVQNR